MMSGGGIEEDASHGAHLDDLDEHPQCCVCMAAYSCEDEHSVPRGLTCGHTFCTGCLIRLCNQERGGLYCVRCPICKHCTYLHEQRHASSDGHCEASMVLQCVQKNYALIDVLDAFSRQREQLMTNALVSGSRSRDDSRSSVLHCAIHDVAKRVYCVDCVHAICIYCQVHGDHLGHHCELVDGAMDYLWGKISVTEAHVEQLYRDSLESISFVKEVLMRDARKFRYPITAKALQLLSVLPEWCHPLMVKCMNVIMTLADALESLAATFNSEGLQGTPAIVMRELQSASQRCKVFRDELHCSRGVQVHASTLLRDELPDFVDGPEYTIMLCALVDRDLNEIRTIQPFSNQALLELDMGVRQMGLTHLIECLDRALPFGDAACFESLKEEVRGIILRPLESQPRPVSKRVASESGLTVAAEAACAEMSAPGPCAKRLCTATHIQSSCLVQAAGPDNYLPPAAAATQRATPSCELTSGTAPEGLGWPGHERTPALAAAEGHSLRNTLLLTPGTGDQPYASDALVALSSPGKRHHHSNELESAPLAKRVFPRVFTPASYYQRTTTS
ncbi:uncharacterized protein LOC135804795 [Sycon ciliatum]|uniref:uncharacterized protein LOC135804795 n=1 Tax=Sycon ciliatum TaxID=27933 RepID=UPI0031F5FA0C